MSEQDHTNIFPKRIPDDPSAWYEGSGSASVIRDLREREAVADTAAKLARMSLALNGPDAQPDITMAALALKRLKQALYAYEDRGHSGDHNTT
jgi:hypothetical protein